MDMAGLPPGDPQLVSMIVNHLKTQGLFDQFRRECLADVDTKPAYLNLKQRVDNFVSNHLSNHTWSPHLNKNQLRNNIRQLVLQSGMLEQGVDRIVAQVVDPKINHIFRPQVERVVREFLSPGSYTDEPLMPPTAAEPKTDTFLEQAAAAAAAAPSSPAIAVTSGALSILDTITTLTQEASVKTSTEKELNPELSEESMELEDGEQDKSLIEAGDSGQIKMPEESEEEKISAQVHALEVKNENNQQLEEDKEEIKQEVKIEEIAPEVPEGAVEEKDKLKSTAKTVEKQDEELKTTSQAKQKAKERIKEEYSLEDSDLEGLSDITVSSVHTSDLSSFEDESDDAQSLSDSSDEGELPDDENETGKKEVSDDGEERQKPRRKAYVHKPFLYSRYYSDSDDEVTVEERRRSAAKDKEERLLKRQQNRERMEERRKQKAAQAEEQNKKNQKMADSTTSERPRAKETRKEQKVLEKKMALNRKRKLDSRKEDDVTRSKKKELCEGPKKETKPVSSKAPHQKLMRHLSESASPDERSRRMSGSVSEDSDSKKISDKNRTHSFILELEQGSQEALKYRSISKFDRPSRKELILKERKEKERHLLNQRARLKQKQAEAETTQKESATLKDDKKAKSKSEKRADREKGDGISKDVKKIKAPPMEQKVDKEKLREKEKEKDLTKDKVKGEKSRTDLKHQLRPESGGSSEDRSDLEQSSDPTKKKETHPKELLKRSKSHSEEKPRARTDSKDNEREKSKTNDPQKSSKSGHEAEKDSKKAKISEKEKNPEKSKTKSKEETKSPVLSKTDKRAHSGASGSPGVRADAAKEKKKVECKKEQRKEEKAENKSFKKKTDKKDLESKDDSRKEKSSKLEKTKSPKAVVPTEELIKKQSPPPDADTNPEQATPAPPTSASEDTCDALSDITPEPFEGDTDMGPSQLDSMPAEADALLTLMNVCASADARLPEPSEQTHTSLAMAQEEADMKMKEAALTLLSMDPDSTVPSDLIRQEGLEQPEGNPVEQMGTSAVVATDPADAKVSPSETSQDEMKQETEVEAAVQFRSAPEEVPKEMTSPQGDDTSVDQSPPLKEDLSPTPTSEVITQEETEDEAATVEKELVGDKATAVIDPFTSTASEQEKTQSEADKKSSQEEEVTTEEHITDVKTSEMEPEDKKEVTASTTDSEPPQEKPGSVAQKPESSLQGQPSLVKQSSILSSTDSQDEKDTEKEEALGRGRRKRKLSRKASEAGDGKGKESQGEENMAKTPRRERLSKVEEAEKGEKTETPGRRGHHFSVETKDAVDDQMKAESKDKVELSALVKGEEKQNKEENAPLGVGGSVDSTDHSEHAGTCPAISDAENNTSSVTRDLSEETAEEVTTDDSTAQNISSQTQDQEEAALENDEKQEDIEDEQQPEGQESTRKRAEWRGRPPKVTTSTEDSKAEDSDEDPKEEELEEDGDMYDEVEDEEKEDGKETATRATTRQASRLEAERNKPSKPSTRASRQSGKDETTAGTRGGARGRKRETSPPVARSRGAQKSEEPPSKRAKR